MTANEYLAELLKSQTIGKDSDEANELQDRRKEVEAILRAAFPNDRLTIRYAGSYIKGTMIRDSYDLDIVCYFSHLNGDSLPEIRRKVEEALATKYYITSKASAVRIEGVKDEAEPLDYHIDVVPGRFVDESEGDAYLHVKYGEKERMKTNLDEHIEFVTSCNIQDILKLAKIWNTRNQLQAKSFVLDIFLIEAMGDYTGGLVNGFKKALAEIRDRFASAEVVDPANSGNIVSNIMTDGEKQYVASDAESALTAISSASDPVQGLKLVLKDQTANQPSLSGGGYSSSPAAIVRPVKPYGSWQ